MKKLLFTVLALFTLLILAGCPTDPEPSSQGSTAKSNNAALTGITVGSQSLNAIQIGEAGTSWSSITENGVLQLSSADANNPTISVTKGNAKATVAFAKINAADVDTATPVFAADSSFTFADGDILYIKVTAENGTTIRYYKLEITIGRNADISALAIGGISLAGNMPNGSTTIAGAAEVQVSMEEEYSGKTYPIAVTLSDTDASAQFATVTGSAVPAFSATAATTPADRDFLYIEVTAANNVTKLYYKVQFNFDQSAVIKYGTPAIVDPDDAANTEYIDPIWNTVTETYMIERPAPESSADFNANPDTSGVAKALWDEDGLWLYVEVTDPDVSEQAATANHHMRDSVELFINEDWDGFKAGNWGVTTSYNNYGGQYRLGANGEKSCDPSAAAALYNPLPSSAWKTATGYVVIFQAPWRFKDTYQLADQKKIGFEMQINCARGTGDSRYGVIVWNNVKSQSYQNVTDYTSATLDLDGNELRVEAKAPTITTQPVGATYNENDTAAALSVAATSPDGGMISYQWYRAVSSTAAPELITGETNADYTPPTDTAGTMYYFARVTNTISGATPGYESKYLDSNRAAIRVVGVTAEMKIEKIITENGSFPVYEFTLPGGDTFSSYTKISAQFMVDDLAEVKRARLLGNYLPADFNATPTLDGFMTISYGNGGNDKNGPYIVDNQYQDTLGALIQEVGRWYTVEFLLDGTNRHPSFNEDNIPAADAMGTFYYAVGITGAGSGAGYYVKNVTMSNDAGTKTVAGICEYNGYPAFVVNTAAGVYKTEDETEFYADFYGHEIGADYFIVGLDRVSVKNDEPIESQYTGYNIRLDLPSSFNINDYAMWTVVIINTDADGDPVVSDYLTSGKFFIPWKGPDVNPGQGGDDSIVLQTTYNISGQNSTQAINADWLTSGDTPQGFRVEKTDAADDGTAFIEVLEIRFHN